MVSLMRYNILGSNNILSDVLEHYSIKFPFSLNKPGKPRSFNTQKKITKFGTWFNGVGTRFNGVVLFETRMPMHGFINEIYLGSNNILSDVLEHYSIKFLFS